MSLDISEDSSLPRYGFTNTPEVSPVRPGDAVYVDGHLATIEISTSPFASPMESQPRSRPIELFEPDAASLSTNGEDFVSEIVEEYSYEIAEMEEKNAELEDLLDRKDKQLNEQMRAWNGKLEERNEFVNRLQAEVFFYFHNYTVKNFRNFET